jgi:hypothetical protein
MYRIVERSGSRIVLIQTICISDRKMNAFYKLATALVAWSALSLTAQAATLDALASLPSDAFIFSVEHPESFGYMKPGIDLSRYHSVLIEPLALLGKQRDEWLLLVAAPSHPMEQHFRQTMTDALESRGFDIASAPGPDVMRLRLAVSLAQRNVDPKQPVQSAFNLDTLADGVDHYMTQVATVGQVEDSLSGGLLAGSADLRPETPVILTPGNNQLGALDIWSSTSAERLRQVCLNQA